MQSNHRRILLVDDNASIHEDFRQILNADSCTIDTEKNLLEVELFAEGNANSTNLSNQISYKIDDAYQGEEAIKMVEDAATKQTPYALIFMDVRMPPGIDGIEAVEAIWKKYPQTEIVICTAHSDYSWKEILKRFGTTDHLLFIQKPFNSVTIKQIALTMTTKWDLDRQNRNHIKDLEKKINERTKDLKKLVKEKEKYIKTIREEMILAEMVQHQLLPNKLPEFKSAEMAATYIPAEKIGGDLYDIISLNDQRVAFLIFDVSGHGIAAALITAIGKFSFRNHLQNENSPERVLELVNKDIFHSTPPTMYITAFLMIYDQKTREAIYSGSGHIPQLHYRVGDNTLDELYGRGLFLGIDEAMIYDRVEKRTFDSGDKIVLFTDGLTETFNNQEKMFGRDRLKEAIMTNPTTKCDDLLQLIIKKNENFKENQYRLDDLCILVIDIK